MALNARRGRLIAVVCIGVAVAVLGAVLGLRLLTPGEAKVRLGLVAQFPVDDRVKDVEFSPDGRLLADRLATGTVQVRATSDGALMRSVPATEAEGIAADPALAFSPDRSSIALGTRPKSTGPTEIDLVSVATGEVTASISVGAAMVHTLAFSPDGGTLAIAGGNDLILWDLTTRATISVATQQHSAMTGDSWYVGYSADAKSLVDVDSQGFARLWDVGTRTFTKSTTLGPDGNGESITVVGVAISRDGSTVVMSGTASHPGPDGSDRSDPKVWFWHPATGVTTSLSAGAARTQPRDEVLAQAVSPDGKQLALGLAYGSVSLWSAPSGPLVAEVPPLALVSSVSALAYAPDGRSLAAARTTPGPRGTTTTVQLWALGTTAGRTPGPPTSGSAAPTGAALPAGDYKVGRRIEISGSWTSTLDTVRVAADGRTTFLVVITNKSTASGRLSCTGAASPVGGSLGLSTGEVVDSVSTSCPDAPGQPNIDMPPQSVLLSGTVFASSRGLDRPFTFDWLGPSGFSGELLDVTLGSPVPVSPPPGSSPSASATGTACGNVGTGPDGRPVRLVIASGSITCPQAEQVLKDYDTSTDHQGSGGFATVDGWTCGHNSAAGYDQSGDYIACTRGSDQFGTHRTP